MFNCENCGFCKMGKYLEYKCPYFSGFPEGNYSVQKPGRDAISQMYIAYCLLNGHRIPKNEKKALAILKKLAKENFAPALYILSDCYYHGIAVKQDLTKAFHLCKKAADYRCDLAVNQTYLNYMSGTGTQQDIGLAKNYCHIAALLENKERYLTYANMCCSEEYGEINIKDACKFYLKAYENGSKEALEKLKELHKNHIQECYESQHSIILNNSLLAIESNKKFADFCINNKFYRQLKTAIKHYGIARDFASKQAEINGNKKAVEEIEKKIENCLTLYFKEIDTNNKALFDNALLGHAWAQNNIGCLFFDPNYELHDCKEAKKWFALAAEQGNEIAQKNLEMCKRHIALLSKPCASSEENQTCYDQSSHGLEYQMHMYETNEKIRELNDITTFSTNPDEIDAARSELYEMGYYDNK